MQFTMILLASLGFNSDVQVGDTVLVPRTEVRESTVLVPQTVKEEVTVYDRYKLMLVPERNFSPVVRMPQPPIVGRFKSRVRSNFIFKSFNREVVR